MTTAEQAYQKYIVKVEKNATNDYISTDRGRFVFIFNEAQNKYLEWILDNKSTDEIRYAQKMLVLDKKLSVKSSKKEDVTFTLPKDYFDFVNIYAFASSDCCSNEKLYLFPIKEENKNEVLQDEFNKPSFKYRESPYSIGSDQVKVYKESTTKIESANLSYYRYPAQISLLDPNNPESEFSKTEIEFDDKVVDRIISIAAGEFDMNQENQRFQLQKQRAIQKP